jgi:RHS repeat-associated protein
LVYFGGKLVSKGAYNSSGTGDKVGLTPLAADRLGSIGKFYPYGTERPSATTNDTEKFTGYFRDASTGLDYADQRYEQPGMGRFMTPDAAPSAKANDPGSWNRYAYTRGDPVNRVDPTGQADFLDYGSMGSGIGIPWNYCDYLCSQQQTWNNIGYWAGAWAQDAVCQALESSFANDGGAWNSNCGDSPNETVAQQPTCSISLWARPVPGADSPALHTYILVSNSSWGPGLLGSDMLEGGPTGNFMLSRLQGFISPPGQGLHGSDPRLASNGQVGPTISGTWVCGVVDGLEANVANYDLGAKVRYNFLALRGTYNSNSFAFTLLHDFGLDYLGASLLLSELAPGWGKTVPGL